MHPQNIPLTLVIAAICASFGYYIGFKDQKTLNQQPLQKCEFNITGTLQKSGGDLFNAPKTKITLFFNGIDVMNGYLSENNEANLIGSYHDTDASAQCSGTDDIKCLITYNNTKTTVTFGDKK